MAGPLRVAIHHTRYTPTGGSEGYLCALVARLLEAGHRVDYYCRFVREAPQHQRLHFHRLPTLRWPRYLKAWSFARRGSQLLSRLRREGAHDLLLGFSKNTYGDYDVYRDGAGCHADYRELYLDRWVRGRWARWWHRLGPYDRRVERIERLRYQDHLPRVVVANSQWVKEQIVRRHGVPESRIRVIYSGVDCERFGPGQTQAGLKAWQELGLGRGRRVLFVGNDYLRKGLPLVIEGLAAVPEAGELLVVGRDGHPERFQRQAEQAGIADRVRFAGPRRDVAQLMAAADLLLLPTWFDAFPNVVLEAFASGLPVVTSRQTGAAELVEEGRTGWVLDRLEGSQVADVLRKFLQAAPDPMREAARQTALQQSWDDHFATLLGLYQEVAGEASR